MPQSYQCAKGVVGFDRFQGLQTSCSNTEFSVAAAAAGEVLGRNLNAGRPCAALECVTRPRAKVGVQQGKCRCSQAQW